jgi:hypothetical protein
MANGSPTILILSFWTVEIVLHRRVFCTLFYVEIFFGQFQNQWKSENRILYDLLTKNQQQKIRHSQIEQIEIGRRMHICRREIFTKITIITVEQNVGQKKNTLALFHSSYNNNKPKKQTNQPLTFIFIDHYAGNQIANNCRQTYNQIANGYHHQHND